MFFFAHIFSILLIALLDDNSCNLSRAVSPTLTACKLTDWNNPEMLDSLAAAYAESGEYNIAIDWQGKPNKLCPNSEDRKKGEERLNLYR